MVMRNKSVLEKPITAEDVEGLGVDHGSLEGLGDDDHTQYFPVDGSRVITGYVDIAEVELPEAPPVNTLRFFVEEFKGFSFPSFIDGTGMERKLVRDSVFPARNESGVAIPIGQPVYASGSSGNVPLIEPADASDIAKMPSIGVVVEEIADEAFGRVMQVGLLEHFDTTAWAESNVLYVAIGGGLTNSAPLYPNIRQQIGTVLVRGVGTGALQLVARSMFNEGLLDHGGLLGLGDDDHPQYTKTAEAIKWAMVFGD